MKMRLKQIIPQEFCLKCEGCCRFIEEKNAWIPQISDSEIIEAVKSNVPPGVFSKTDIKDHHLNVIKQKDSIICEFLSTKTNKCRIYANRPLDCQIYPFILENKAGRISLGLHLECPFVKENLNKKEFKEYIKYMKDFISEKETRAFINKNQFLAGNYGKFKNQIKTICYLE